MNIILKKLSKILLSSLPMIWLWLSSNLILKLSISSSLRLTNSLYEYSSFFYILGLDSLLRFSESSLERLFISKALDSRSLFNSANT